MGLLTGLLTLPLAPVRGVFWVAEQIEAEVDREMNDPGVLRLNITDDGRGVNAHARSNGGGHGLIGMRERVAAYGGTFSAGPKAGGGFAVTATLPYGAD